MTLQEIITKEEARAKNDGIFGVNACKKSIEWDVSRNNVSLYTLLEEYVKSANTDVFFNKTMVYACWLMINEK